jgi:hypothetical protein
VVNWFRRKRTKRVDAPRLRPRSEDAANATKVDLAELTPDRDRFLGQAAYLQLTLFEDLSRLVATAPTIEAKEALSRAVSVSLDRYQKLSAEIRRTGGEPSAVMAPYTSGIDFFQGATQSSDWYESLVTSHITAGILDDFFALLAVGLPGADAARITAIYAADSHEPLIAEQIRLGIAANPRLSSRLAMWGRRLVGDSMLVARSALATPLASATDEARIEPVFTEVIAAHTRRMDALGLTA